MQKKKNSFYEQNNSSARFLVHVFMTSTARLRSETFQCDILWKTWTYDNKFSVLYFNMDGKVAYLWRIERF